MFFLLFLFLGGIVWILGLAFMVPARLRWGAYTPLSLLFLLAGMVLFALFSWWAGIMTLRFGDDALITYSIDFPAWYLARGAVGLAIIFVGLLAVISPILAAWLVTNPQKPSIAQ